MSKLLEASSTMGASNGMDYSRIGVQDSILNNMSGIGTSKDQGANNQFFTRLITDQTAIEIYRGSWLAARIVDVLVHESLREWRRFTMPDDTGESEQLIAAERKYKVKDAIKKAARWSHVFGGSAILINVENSGDIKEELDVNAIKRGSLKWLTVLDKRRVIPFVDNTTTTDPSGKYYMRPEFYNVGGTVEGSTRVHRSRLVVFDGIELPHDEYIRNQYWGDSIYTRVFDAISNADITQQAISSLVHKANIDLWRIKDLQGNLEKKDGQSHITKRISVNNMLASIVNAVVTDFDNEAIERLQINFASLDKILSDYLHIVCSASGVPATKLLGSSSDGMNATGEGDIRNFYDHIKSYQDNFLHERLDYLDRIVAMSTFGSIPQDYGFEFNPLWQPTDKEVAEVQNIQAQRDMAYLNAGVMTPQNIAEELLHRETYQSLTPDDVEELGDMGVSSSMFNDPDFDLGGDDGADNNA